MTKTSNKNDSKDKSILAQNLVWILLILLLIGITCAIVAVSFYLHTFDGGFSAKPDSWGQFGDYVGGTLNPLFAFLAFIALLLTIILQSKELSLTTKELADSSRALKEQSKSLKKQTFENTFFQMLRFHNEIINDIDLVDREGKITKGRDCFSVFYRRLGAKISISIIRRKGTPPIVRKMTESIYMEFYEDHQSEIGHYFRNLYNIIKFVHENEIYDKKFYTNLVRAQLSVDELTLLFYNCEFGIGKTKFKPFVEKYALLKTINKNNLLDKKHMNLYNKTAFS